MTRDALGAEYGGEVQTLFRGFSQRTLEDPEKFAKEVYKTYGTGALRYFVTIVKYADSGKFNPEQDAEDRAGEQEFESLVQDIEANSSQDSDAETPQW